ncbi:MAG: tryptophan 2,3-dioxygenase family protein [Ornithinimicrobium sp.]|uniref:tryptophan 2,3-dioxygenase n=1 Tax=Ornithinimicrobium sp. TaxID=1977084 RepID=UPI0026DF22F4|nr:tryptophan 2,3-dioxygenase family protein [Ornithinimicrobium sp.]MDO5739564.1 tryptophan 2,3-dioxygenase family protein [Ornithinimicrobium sp.]
MQHDDETDTITGHGRAIRDVEAGIERDFGKNLSYSQYLDLPTLLSAQHPRAVPPRHDEMLFIIQHHTSELWLKLMLHELDSARALIASDQIHPALKRIARIKHIQHCLTDQWTVLATLTPSEYAQFRSFLATGSGFQSWQYRAVEFSLGNKNPDMLRVFAHDPEVHAHLERLLHEPSLYDEVLRFLARAGHPVPKEVLERDVTAPYEGNQGVVDVFAAIYDAPLEHWLEYEIAEELVDVEDNFQVWRFRHLKTVERIIGSKRGTGGSSGVPFLRRALDLTFFPELYDVRSRIQDVTAQGYHGGEGA